MKNAAITLFEEQAGKAVAHAHIFKQVGDYIQKREIVPNSLEKAHNRVCQSKDCLLHDLFGTKPAHPTENQVLDVSTLTAKVGLHIIGKVLCTFQIEGTPCGKPAYRLIPPFPRANHEDEPAHWEPACRGHFDGIIKIFGDIPETEFPYPRCTTCTTVDPSLEKEDFPNVLVLCDQHDNHRKLVWDARDAQIKGA